MQAAQQQVAGLTAELEEARKALADEQKQRQAHNLALTMFLALRLPACQCITAGPRCSRAVSLAPFDQAYICSARLSWKQTVECRLQLGTKFISAACCRRELESSSTSTTEQASRRLEELGSAAESAKEQLSKTQRQLDAVRAELRTKALEVYVLSEMWLAC